MKAKILLLLTFLIMFSSGCSSRKVETHKEVEKLEELTQNDIKKEKSAVFSSETISNIYEKNIKATSTDPDKPSKLNITGNTLSWQNATVDISNKKEDVTNKTSGNTTTKQEDKSSASKDSIKKDKARKSERTSASWGLNFGLILAIIAIAILIYWKYFK